MLRQLDQLYLKCPFFGSRKMAVELEVNRKRIQRLMRILGIEAHYPKPNLSRPQPGHEVTLPAARRGDRAAQPRLEHRYYLPSDTRRLSVSGRGDGLVQPLCAQLGTLRHDGNRFLPDGAGRRFVSANPKSGTPIRARSSPRPTSWLRSSSRGILISMDGRGRALDKLTLHTAPPSHLAQRVDRPSFR